MSSVYRWVAHQQAVEFLLRLPAINRRNLLESLDNLAEDPFQEVDASLVDSNGRKLQIKIAGRFIITFWADHAVKELRVVAIEVG